MLQEAEWKAWEFDINSEFRRDRSLNFPRVGNEARSSSFHHQGLTTSPDDRGPSIDELPLVVCSAKIGAMSSLFPCDPDLIMLLNGR